MESDQIIQMYNPTIQDAEAIEMRDFKAYLSYEFKASLRNLTKPCNPKAAERRKSGVLQGIT